MSFVIGGELRRAATKVFFEWDSELGANLSNSRFPNTKFSSNFLNRTPIFKHRNDILVSIKRKRMHDKVEIRSWGEKWVGKCCGMVSYICEIYLSMFCLVCICIQLNKTLFYMLI